jgi:hypothetical protein
MCPIYELLALALSQMHHDIPIYEYEFLVSNSYQSLGFGQESVWGRISYVTLQVRYQADSGPAGYYHGHGSSIVTLGPMSQVYSRLRMCSCV